MYISSNIIKMTLTPGLVNLPCPRLLCAAHATEQIWCQVGGCRRCLGPHAGLPVVSFFQIGRRRRDGITVAVSATDRQGRVGQGRVTEENNGGRVADRQ